MTRRQIAGGFSLVLLGISRLTYAQQTVDVLLFRSHAPGLEVLHGQLIVAGKRVAITAIRASLDGYRLEVGIPQNASSGESMLSFQERSHAAVVLSGGFLTSFFPPIPLGLVRHGSVLVNRAAGGDLLDGVLLVAAGKLSIQRFRGAGDLEGWAEALQSGPMLLSAGRSALPDVADIKTRSTRQLIDNEYSRAFIATLADGRLLLAVTGAVSLRALADYLVRSAPRGGLACIDALNLGGGGSEGILVTAAAGRVSSGNIQSYLANTILLKSTAGSDSRRATPIRKRK